MADPTDLSIAEARDALLRRELSAEELAQEASSLLGELLPEIMRCVPDWVEVESGRYPANNEGPGSGKP